MATILLEQLPWGHILSYLATPREVAAVAQTNRHFAAVTQQAHDHIWYGLATYRYGQPIVAAESSSQKHYGGDYEAMLRDDNRKGTWINLTLAMPLTDTIVPEHIPRNPDCLQVVAVQYQRDLKLLRFYIRGGQQPETMEYIQDDVPVFDLERLDRPSNGQPFLPCIMMQFNYNRLPDVYCEGIGPSLKELGTTAPSNGDNSNNKCRVFQANLGYLDSLCNHPLKIKLHFGNDEFELFTIPAAGTVEDGFRMLDNHNEDTGMYSYSLYEAPPALPKPNTAKGLRRVKQALTGNNWHVLQ